MSTRLTDNLKRLLEALNACTTIPAARRKPPSDHCGKIAKNLSLTHSTGSRVFPYVLNSNALYSALERDRLKLSPKPLSKSAVEHKLSTADDVFTYVGQFRYPRTACGFLFKLDLESSRANDAIATPFDSGGVIHFLRRGDPPEQQVDFLRSHELPVPAFRDYFRSSLALLFDSPWDYLDSNKGPDVEGPIKIVAGDQRKWTFELRFPKKLEFTGTLECIFAPLAVAATKAVNPHLMKWEDDGIAVMRYKSKRESEFHDLQNACHAYVKKKAETWPN